MVTPEQAARLALLPCLLALAAGCSDGGAVSHGGLEFPSSLRSESLGEDKRVVTVPLRNVASRPVRVTAASSTCGCTLPELPDQLVIEPGEEYKLAVTLSYPPYGSKASRLNLATTAGRFTIPVELVGEDMPAPYVSQIESPVRLAGDVSGSEAARTITVRTIEDADSESPWLHGLRWPDGRLAPATRVGVREDISGQGLLCEYECELAAAIPRPARRVPADASQHRGRF